MVPAEAGHGRRAAARPAHSPRGRPDVARRLGMLPALMDAAQPAPRTMRLAGLILVGLWIALGVAVGVAYRPGGQLDLLVAAVAFLPAVVAAAAVAWPAVTRSHRHAVGLAWIWSAALLLTIPLLYGVVSSLASAGPQPLVPSPESAYGSYLALASTALFSLLGVVHARASSPVF